jgi:hypothetical protein
MAAIIEQPPIPQISFIQSDFSGGMNLYNDETKIGADQYGLAFNVRNRAGSLESVQDKEVDDSAPTGKMQGTLRFRCLLAIVLRGKSFLQKRSN